MPVVALSLTGLLRRASVILAALVLPAVVAMAVTKPAAAAGPQTGVAGASGRPAIRVTMDDNYPPFTFRDPSGAQIGILKDLWDLWSKKTGVRVELAPMDWGLARKAMEEGRADVIDTIFRTPAREQLLDFSAPYASIAVPIVFRSEISGIGDVNSLRGFAVGVKEGDACIDWLAERSVTEFRRYASYESLVEAAIRHEVVVMCIDEPPARYFLNKRGVSDQFRQTEPLYSGEFHWAVRKGDQALHDLVASGFAAITPEERKAIETRWYGRTLGGFADPVVRRALVRVVLAVAVIGIAMLAWNALLRREVAARTRNLREVADALAVSEERFRSIFDSVNDAIFIHDPKTGAILMVNRRMREMYLIGDRPVSSIDLSILSAGIPPYTVEQAAGWMEKAASEGAQMFEWYARRLDGELFWVEVNMRLATLDGSGQSLLVVARDISERKVAQARMDFLAYHDPLTLLPNRLLLHDRVTQAIARAEQGSGKVALLLCDLDRFKTINDSLGHAAGDDVLRAVAERLKRCVQETDVVSRHGGDEFAIALTEVPNADAVTEMVALIHETLARPFLAAGQEVSISLSTGIALWPDDGADFPELLRKADTAAYHAKSAGRDAHRFFTEAMNRDALAHLAIRNGLRRAMQRGELLLHYQPQVALDGGAVVGAEALVRWNHPQRGLVPPGEFIPIAEDSGLIVPLGEWVLREACRQAAAWRAQGLTLPVAVNLSALQVQHPDLERTVVSALENAGLDPLLLELELTESMLIQNTETVVGNIRKLKAMGVQLSIDDFGTGYSSLAYIRRLAVDKLKIDRSFIQDLRTNHDSAKIAAAVIQMAHSLSLTTVAEGVEDAETLDRLRQLHCDVVQGYFTGRPGPAEAVAELARAAANASAFARAGTPAAPG